MDLEENVLLLLMPDSKIDTVTISNQGSGYTYGNLDLVAGGVPTGTTRFQPLMLLFLLQVDMDMIFIRELGAMNVLLYSRIENDNENPDFITGNQIARVGIVENPKSTGTTLLSADKASATWCFKIGRNWL